MAVTAPFQVSTPILVSVSSHLYCYIYGGLPSLESNVAALETNREEEEGEKKNVYWAAAYEKKKT